MYVKGLLDEDFLNYKKPSMTIMFPTCNWKCERECGERVCQNSALAKSSDIQIGIKTIVNRYINNPITNAIVFGGLEPLDSWQDVYDLITYLRVSTLDDIVIYTGYKEEEIEDKLQWLQHQKNIIIKFGRFVPNQKPHFDEEIGVWLASDNQYARQVSK